MLHACVRTREERQEHQLAILGMAGKRTPLRLKKGIHKFESVGFSLMLFHVEISPRQSFCKLSPDDSQTF